MPKQKRHANRVYQVVGEPGPGATVAGYVRYSSELQDVATIVTQKRKIQEYADKKGWTIARWYEEPEQSAKYEEIERRAIFAQLLEDAGRQFAVVLCYMNNRWSRNVPVAYTSLGLLRRKRVWWATADGLWDIDKVQQDGFDVAFAVDTQMNAAYVRQLSKRVIDGKEDRARDGYHNGSVPFGYLPPEYPKAPDGAPSTWKPPRMPVRRDPINFPALVRLGELAAQGWADAAIADELAGHFSITPRFGQRPLTKDTVAAIRRSWFPREFAPGSGRGTIETPAGELVEGKHPAAWPYELWQRILEVKGGQYRRPRQEAQRRAHEFSRIIVCVGCRRPLRISPSQGVPYYRDSSLERKLPCPAFGCLSVSGRTVVRQFGDILRAVTLPALWRDAVAARCREATRDEGAERILTRRAELEAEQKRQVLAFTKGYLTERDLDTQVERIRGELLSLPIPVLRDADDCTRAAISAGETLSDMAGYWEEATSEERRDIVWALLALGGLVYDLEHQGIVGLIPRPAVLPVLALGLAEHWEQQGDELWLREQYRHEHATRGDTRLMAPPYRAHKLTPERRAEALDLVRAGMSPQQVAERLGTSYWEIFRLMKRHEPTHLPQHQSKLTPAQEVEARELLRRGKTLRQVGAHFGVSYGAIWRLTQRDARTGAGSGERSDGHGDENGGDA
jgi:site-specific DNA recombinase